MTDDHADLGDVMGVPRMGVPVDFAYAPIFSDRQEPPYAELDPGIRETTRWLFENGFAPTDSGDGVSKIDTMDCAIPDPHVYLEVDDPDLLIGEVERLHRLLIDKGIHIFNGPMTPAEAEEFGVSWEGIPKGAIKGTLEGSYAPGGPAMIIFVGVNDELLGGGV